MANNILEQLEEVYSRWSMAEKVGKDIYLTQPDAGWTASTEDASRSRIVRRDDETSGKDDSKEIR